MTHDRLRPFYFIAAGVLLQGLSPVLTKLLLDYDISPATLVAFRYLIAVLVLVPFGWRHRSDATHEPPRPRDWIALFLVGALGSGIASLLFTHAIDMTSAGVATAISKTAPIFVAFFAYFTLRERITSARLALVLLMVAADVLIGMGELNSGDIVRQRLVGDMLALGAGALRALAEILSKTSLRRFFPATVAMWRFGVGFVVTALIALGGGEHHRLILLDGRGWLMLLVLGALCTSLSMSLYYRGLRHIQAHVGVSLRLLSAIVTVVVSWQVLNEPLNGLHIAGIAVLVAGAYLIVVRTTRQPLLRVELEAVRPAPRLAAHRTLKGRVALMVAAMIAITVMGTTVLSVHHASGVLQEHVRLTVVKIATIIVQLTGVAQPPSQETYRQYLDRIIHLQFANGSYSIEITYLAVLDENGNVIAFAKRGDVAIHAPDGRLMSSYGSATARRVMELAQSGELSREYDMYSLSVPLVQDDHVVGTVKMGSRRALLSRDARDIALRNLSLAVLLIILGVFASYYFTDYLARPLERLSSIVRRISNGELDAPLIALGTTEVESLGASVARMADNLRQGQMLRDSLANCICLPADQRQPLPAVSLLVRLGGESSDERGRQFEALLEAVSRNEGTLAAFAPGYVLAVFGGPEPEQDDVLRAAVAALDWQAWWLDENKPAVPPLALIGLTAQAPPADQPARALPQERLEQLAQELESAPSPDRFAIYITEAAASAAARHLDTTPIVAGKLYEITEPQPVQPLDELKEE